MASAPAPSDDVWEDIDSENVNELDIPMLFLDLPPVQDLLQTTTSELQEQTLQEMMPYLAGDLPKSFDYNKYGVPALKREQMVRFLKRFLNGMPQQFYAADASRPWFLYWCLGGLTLLGEDVSSYRDGIVATSKYLQNRTGGYGGGYGYMSHLATSYAVVQGLVAVGGEAALEAVDRKAMWEWLSELKQADGGFEMVVGGEVDIRGAYCAASIISLLGLPLDLAPTSRIKDQVDGSFNLFSNVGEYVRRCQTYEGGISGKPDAEAHGAYAFCALGCLSIVDVPYRSVPKYLDVPRLISWLSARQNAPEGGLSGRTNKLVDGCYSHWAGGCWPILEAVLNGPCHKDNEAVQSDASVGESAAATAKGSSAPFVQSIMSREGLIRYILCCCQDENLRANAAGMRDKPGKPSDSYHTLYVLAGLSSAQHSWNLYYDESTGDYTKWDVSPYQFGDRQIFDEASRIKPCHPIYVLPPQRVYEAKEYFMKKAGF
ncbi:hypothetical protein TD95_002857 [Thielaviopsis punctulata]|uniref:Protein farnesyltransferase subunit beta n=1 Tax=Thielaviopsis punctulata TaxID=72032 RepID=A0A0F4ZE65_9PEZI|nr:hypothetical protein TD95_002857 [Thielaviopsis punctulata]